MKEILIGQIVNTHGLKGELRIISSFPYKELVFKKGMQVYVGFRKDLCTINSYRHHKIYDMVTFEGINSIDNAIAYKGDYVYVNRDDIKFDGYLPEDIIGFSVYDKELSVGKIVNVVNNGAHDILVIENEKQQRCMVPLVDAYVKDVDLPNKQVIIEAIEGMLYEN